VLPRAKSVNRPAIASPEIALKAMTSLGRSANVDVMAAKTIIAKIVIDVRTMTT